MSSREHSAGANELLNQRLCFIKLTPHYYQTEAPFSTHVYLLQRQKIIFCLVLSLVMFRVCGDEWKRKIIYKRRRVEQAN